MIDGIDLKAIQRKLAAEDSDRMSTTTINLSNAREGSIRMVAPGLCIEVTGVYRLDLAYDEMDRFFRSYTKRWKNGEGMSDD